MKKIFSLAMLSAVMLLSGCVAFQVGGEIQKGRMELIQGNPKVALVHFQRAAELNPNYILHFTYLPQGVWTYVGRAYYAQGRFAEAAKALAEARSRHQEDSLAKLYLGLVHARDGNRQGGLKEMEAGLVGLKDWFDRMEQYHPAGRFWDPGKRIRSEIKKELEMISGKEFNWTNLIASAEWVAQQIEEEIDFARQDEIDELYRNNGDDGGMD